MNKIVKITFFILIFICLGFTISYGDTSQEWWGFGPRPDFVEPHYDPSTRDRDDDVFDIRDLTGSNFSNQETLDLGNKIVTILSAIGSVTSVIVLIVLGLKYMTGTVSQKADYKKTLIPYVIGAVLVFAASAIAGAIYNVIPK